MVNCITHCLDTAYTHEIIIWIKSYLMEKLAPISNFQMKFQKITFTDLSNGLDLQVTSQILQEC